MQRLIKALAILAILGLGGFWVLTIPHPLEASAIASHAPDVKNGEMIFNLGGCASCHAAKGAKGDDRLKLAGGQALETPFGTFRVPNITPDPETGVGKWSVLDVVNAVTRGVSPGGRHYYPAFPYASYSRLTISDAIDLAGYLKTLPAVSNKVADHTLPFPFNIRRGLGLWKLLFLKPGPVLALGDVPADVKRGQYIVEGPGHCGECHTPRNPIGGLETSQWLAGAPVLEGKGRVPDITPHQAALGAWSITDITFYLESGLTPDGDAVGGAMTEVVENMSKISKEDRSAIAAYLKVVPPVAPPPKPPKT
jgi:mono/diheme cytochrome c family protein